MNEPSSSTNQRDQQRREYKKTFVGEYLDREEKRLAAGGFTKWAMLLASAAIFWKLLDYLSASQNWQVVAECFCILVSLQILHMIFHDVLDDEKVGIVPRLIPLNIDAGSDRKLTVLRLIKLVVAIIVLYRLFVGSENWGRWLAGIPIGLFAVVGVVHFVESYSKEWEVIADRNSGVVENIIFTTLFSGCLVAGLVAICFQSQFVNAVASSPDAGRFALLLFVLSWLLEQSLAAKKNEGRVTAARDIWLREGFGEISAEDAVAQLNGLVIGSKISDIASRNIREFQDSLDELARLTKQIEQEIALLHMSSSGGSSVPIDTIKNSIEKRLIDAKSQMDTIELERKNIERRLLKIGASQLKQEIQEIVSELSEKFMVHKTMLEGIARNCSKEFESLSETGVRV